MNRTRARLPQPLIDRLQIKAQHRCGYCLTSEALIGMPMEIEHLMPFSLGGTDDESNLWLSCRRCNGFKGTQQAALDSATNELQPLFNPRLQVWAEHFAWNADGTIIIGVTAIGRASIVALKMNNPEIIVARRLWVSVGWWPPSE